MKEIIRYAHCTKFTPGQLDIDPYSAYELRETEIDVLPTFDDNGAPEWTIMKNGNVLACERKMGDALGIAAYELMSKSRDIAYHAFAHAYLAPPDITDWKLNQKKRQ